MTDKREVLGQVDGKDVVQMEDVERAWASMAFKHAEVYERLLATTDCRNLHLTKIDDELYNAFSRDFPDVNVALLNEEKHFKSEEMKERWRTFLARFEDRVPDFNVGTLLRINPADVYTPLNSILVVRLQFLCVEIARNRSGLNVSLSRQND